MFHARILPAVLLAAVFVTACAPVINKRGNLVETEKLDQITSGRSTREDVARILGTPTEMSTFDDKIWYYIGQTTKREAFFDPEVTEQKIVAIRFTPEGVVDKISQGGAQYAENISPNPGRTPTYGKDISLLQQLMGNLGRPRVPVSNRGR